MQQTKLDRWLRDKFVNETLVMTVREPPVIPKGIKLKELPPSLNNQYRYQMVIRKASDLDAVLTPLKKKSQTFTTRVRHRKGTAARYFANPSGKSFSMTLLAAILGASLVFSVVIFFPNMLIDYFNKYVTPMGKTFKDTAVDTYEDVFGSSKSEEKEETGGIRESTPSEGTPTPQPEATP